MLAAASGGGSELASVAALSRNEVHEDMRASVLPRPLLAAVCVCVDAGASPRMDMRGSVKDAPVMVSEPRPLLPPRRRRLFLVAATRTCAGPSPIPIPAPRNAVRDRQVTNLQRRQQLVRRGGRGLRLGRARDPRRGDGAASTASARSTASRGSGVPCAAAGRSAAHLGVDHHAHVQRLLRPRPMGGPLRALRRRRRRRGAATSPTTSTSRATPPSSTASWATSAGRSPGR